MATLKICVRKQRNDGYWPVYIRVTHGRKIGYIKTDKTVSNKYLSRNGEIEDPYVLKSLSNKIVAYYEQLNRVDIENWDVNGVINYLRCGVVQRDISFSFYIKKHLDKLYSEGRLGTYHYRCSAVRKLYSYAGKDELFFSDLTPKFIQGWIASMEHIVDAVKAVYVGSIRVAYMDALKAMSSKEYEVVSKYNPWSQIELNHKRTEKKRAITTKTCRRFFAEEITAHTTSVSYTIARDVSMMSLCLAGMNLRDIYHLQKSDYYDGIIHYQRSKTKGRRADRAYMEMRVPAILYPLFEKYATDSSSPYLFKFHEIQKNYETFLTQVSLRLRTFSRRNHYDELLCFYAFRHT